MWHNSSDWERKIPCTIQRNVFCVTMPSANVENSLIEDCLLSSITMAMNPFDFWCCWGIGWMWCHHDYCMWLMPWNKFQDGISGLILPNLVTSEPQSKIFLFISQKQNASLGRAVEKQLHWHEPFFLKWKHSSSITRVWWQIIEEVLLLLGFKVLPSQVQSVHLVQNGMNSHVDIKIWKITKKTLNFLNDVWKNDWKILKEFSPWESHLSSSFLPV